MLQIEIYIKWFEIIWCNFLCRMTGNDYTNLIRPYPRHNDFATDHLHIRLHTCGNRQLM